MAGPGSLTPLSLPPSLASLEQPDALRADALPGRPLPSHHRGVWALSLSQCGVSCAGLAGGQTRAFSTLAFQTPLGWVRLGRDRATLEGPGPLTCPLVMGYSPGGGGPSPVFGAWGREDLICYSAKFCNGCLAHWRRGPLTSACPRVELGGPEQITLLKLSLEQITNPCNPLIHTHTASHPRTPHLPLLHCFFFFFNDLFILFLAVLGLPCCMGFSLVAMRRVLWLQLPGSRAQAQ